MTDLSVMRHLLTTVQETSDVISPEIRDAASTEATGTDNRLVILVISMAIVLFISITFLIIRDKRKHKWGKRNGCKGSRKLSDRIGITLYQFIKEFPLTRNYVEKLSFHYRLISPCDTKEIAKKTVIACVISWGICILTFLLVFIMNPRFGNLVTVIAAIIIVNAEVIGRMSKQFQITSLFDTQKLIDSLCHNFYVNYRVDDALYRSRDGLSPNMKVAVDQIYQLLLSEDKEEALREYYVNIPNKYLRALVSQCVGVMERGDQELNGKPLFIQNLEKLYREIDIEIEKQQRLNLEFFGVITCVIAPIFCIDYVKRFAISIKENMVTFFYGKEGFLLDTGLILLIVLIYIIMQKSAEYTTFHQSKHRWLYAIDRVPFIKKVMDNYCDKNATKLVRLKRDLRNNGNNIKPRHFMLRSFLIAGAAFAFSIGMFFYLHNLSRTQLLIAESADVELLTSAAKENQYEAMGEVIEKYTALYTLRTEEGPPKDAPASRDELVEILKKDGAFYNKVINEALSDDILRRVHAFDNEYFSFCDLALCLLIGIVALYLPKLMLKYNTAVSKDAMEDEVNQFNALISMLKYIDSMTVKQILEELESFAVVFKQSLRNCINDFGSGDMAALEALKEQEPYEPFNRIVDNLIRCDDMPVYEAFNEIDVDRDGYMAKRKLANEKSIKKRVIRAYLLAAVPFLLLFAYALIPTLIATISEINATIKELEGSNW